MIRTTLASVAVAVMAGSAFGADANYNFPSQAIPGNVPVKDVKQYVSFIWDDNGYSGELGTSYEPKSGKLDYKDMGFVGNMIRDWATDSWKMKVSATDQNPLKIFEGDMGLSWARLTLGGVEKPSGPVVEPWSSAVDYPAGALVVYNGHIWKSSAWMAKGVTPKVVTGGNSWDPVWLDQGAVTSAKVTKKNSDGTPIGMTFNMISGLYVPAWGTNWQDRKSHWGSYTDAANPYVDDKKGFKSIAIAWGREGKYGAKEGDDRDGTDFMVQGVKKLIAAGHEIGNHTIDHLETNSPFPLNLWPNNGDGFDDGKSGKDALGNPWSEVEEFGGAKNGFQQTCGWKSKAGMAIQKQTWKDILTLGEKDGPLNGIDSKLGGFRAPRLEVNSSMFYALAEKGYLYDCGNEEGYELYRDGTNFVWPYTMDNGNPNAYTQKMNGETVISDSLPNGLWEFPVNCMIVPKEIRGAVYDQYSIIAKSEDPTFKPEPKSWDGKITGFDFNMFILWSMTGDQVLQTLKNTLDLRMSGNKAPMQIGCHTDYFTPIYDNATLLNDANKDKYGLSLKYNTWVDRKKCWEDFVDYGLKQGALFKTGKETIEYVKSLVGKSSVGSKEVAIAPSEWEFGGSKSKGADKIASLNDAEVIFDKAEGAWGGYEASIENGADLGNMSHVSMDYKTNVPLEVSLFYGENGSEGRRDIILNNLSRSVSSGKIPYEAFTDFEETSGTSKILDSKKITAIAIYPQSNGDQAVTAKFSVKNIKFYAGAVSSIAGVSKNASAAIAVNGISNGKLNLNVNRAGQYSVGIYSVAGKLVKSINASTLATGASSLNVGELATGMYVLKIQGAAGTIVTKAMAR